MGKEGDEIEEANMFESSHSSFSAILSEECLCLSVIGTTTMILKVIVEHTYA